MVKYLFYLGMTAVTAAFMFAVTLIISLFKGYSVVEQIGIATVGTLLVVATFYCLQELKENPDEI